MNKKIVIPALTLILMLSMTAFMPAFAVKQGKGPPEEFWFWYIAADPPPPEDNPCAPNWHCDKMWYSGVKLEDGNGVINHVRGMRRTLEFHSSIGDGIRMDIRSRECDRRPKGWPEQQYLCVLHKKVEIEFTGEGEGSLGVGTLSGIGEVKFNNTWVWGTFNFDRGTGDYEGYHAWGIINSCLGHY